MIWLIGLIVILQAGFHWLLKPAIVLSTPIFEVRGIILLIFLIGAWIISAKVEVKDVRNIALNERNPDEN